MWIDLENFGNIQTERASSCKMKMNCCLSLSSIHKYVRICKFKNWLIDTKPIILDLSAIFECKATAIACRPARNLCRPFGSSRNRSERIQQQSNWKQEFMDTSFGKHFINECGQCTQGRFASSALSITTISNVIYRVNKVTWKVRRTYPYWQVLKLKWQPT